MNRAVPTITESAESLKILLKAEDDAKRAQRLQVLYLFASQQVKTRKEAATILGVHRGTIGAWLDRYAAGGVDAMLEVHVAPGKPSSLPPEVESALCEALATPTGFSSYGEMVDWLWQQHGIRLAYSTVHTLVRYKLKARPKVARRSNRKKTDAIETFKAEVVERISEAIPADHAKPLKVWTQDESRWGLMTILRRRITLEGVKPIIKTQHQYANCWLYGAVAPESGERFFLLLPRLDATNMHIFWDLFAEAHSDTFNAMLMDQRGAHTAKWLRIPTNMALVFFAPACPERNPTERLWEDLHSKLEGQCFAHLDCLEDEICAHLDDYTDPIVQSLTGYPYLREAINAVCS